MPTVVIRGQQGNSQKALDAVESGLISWIEGNINETLDLSNETVVITNS